MLTYMRERVMGDLTRNVVHVTCMLITMYLHACYYTHVICMLLTGFNNMHVALMLTYMQDACDMTGDAMCILTCMQHVCNMTGDATCILIYNMHATCHEHKTHAWFTFSMRGSSRGPCMVHSIHAWTLCGSPFPCMDHACFTILMHGPCKGHHFHV